MYQHPELTAPNYQQQPKGHQHNGVQMSQQQFIEQLYQGQQQPIIQTMQPPQHQGQQQAPPLPPTEQAMVAQQSIGNALAQNQPVYQAVNLGHFSAHV
ncbi:hypothetical protein BV898_01925 [Hypsibius exemplaris]|uniref:Uncharacterized protein n=1 Tax=Hypsibius exemplaris TaxID=2072580 RepID=A0A1W0XAG2_HYPEX|nr:hypothetical protein BV898_01925 [Hypsibius exemplaris]